MTERVLLVDWVAGEASALLPLARDLAGPGGALAVLSTVAGNPWTSSSGIDTVYQVAAPGFDATRADHLALAIAEATRALPATLVLSGPAKVEREAVARAGALLDAVAITGVRAVRVGPDGIELSRDLLSGNATGIESFASRPALLSLSIVPASAGPDESPPKATQVVALPVELPTYDLRRISRQPKPVAGVDLEAADRIVSVGRGLQKREDLALIEGLARALGAAVGCTRPIAAESGWLGDDHWVGLTGHRVRPTLYVAVGISGAAQHLVGMRDSKIVVAINKDANAPIFQQADYQVVGDLYAILPELTRLLTAASTAPS